MSGFVRSMLTLRHLVELLAVAGLGLLIWNGGPPGHLDFIPWMGDAARLVLIAGVFAGWLLIFFVLYRRRRRASSTLFRSLSENARVTAPGTPSELELEELRQPLAEALALLREEGGQGRGRDYAEILPWILVLGLPGSGKTALVERSGLPMPLEERLGRRGIQTRIAGNTRWWFTEDGLLISPGGRSLAPSGDAPPALWRALLGFLLARRPRRPVDGALLLVDAGQMLSGEGPAAAATLRLRLQEAMRAFGARMQVYLVVTKADRLAGFREYFGLLDREERSEAFGVLMPSVEPGGQGRVLARLREDLAALGERVGRELVGKVSAERDAVRRARACTFPEQLGRLAEEIERFCAELLRAGRLDRVPLLRGAFLTSAGPGPAATPEGGTLDAWAPGLATGFGLLAPSAAAAGGASPLFCDGLLRQVVFRDVGLVGRNQRAEQRLLLLHGLGYAACLAALAVSFLLWGTDFHYHDDLLAGMRATARTEAEQIAALPAVPRLSEVLPALDTARGLTVVDAQHTSGNPLGIRQALAAARESYRELLLRLLLPVLRRDLEGQLRAAVAAGANQTRVRDLLSIYLQLGSPQHFSRAEVAGWTAAALSRDLAFQPQLVADAQLHTAALLDLLPVPLPLDGGLVADARAMLRFQPNAVEVYDRLKTIALQSGLPPVDVVASLGPAGSQLLMLRAQARLPTVIPALYTREGFYQVFLARAPVLVRDLGSSDWVLGSSPTTEAQAQALLRQVVDLYVHDYVGQWQRMLDQISLRALPDLAAVTAALQTLSGVDSPLVQLVALVRAQTNLPPPAPPATLLSRAEGAATAAAGRAGVPAAAAGAAAGAAEAMAGGGGFAGMPWPGEAIGTVFAPLQALTDASGGQAPVLRVQNTLSGAYGTVYAVSAALDPGAAAQQLAAQVISGQSTDQLIGLRVQAATLPRPVGDILRELYADVWSSLLQLAATRLQTLWARDVDAACQETIAGRYPFVLPGDGSVSADVDIPDFAAFFGRGGTMDKFVTADLSMFTQPGANGDLVPIVTSGLSLGISRLALAQINRARRVRDLFFGADGNPRLRFFMTPSYLDPRATTATLSIDGTVMRYRHDPAQTVQVAWPAADGGSARFSLITVGGQTPSLAASGPWALFHLLDQAQRTPGATRDQQEVSFTLDGLRSSWILRASSVINPFTTTDPMAFRCVPRL